MTPMPARNVAEVAAWYTPKARWISHRARSKPAGKSWFENAARRAGLLTSVPIYCFSPAPVRALSSAENLRCSTDDRLLWDLGLDESPRPDPAHHRWRSFHRGRE